MLISKPWCHVNVQLSYQTRKTNIGGSQGEEITITILNNKIYKNIQKRITTVIKIIKNIYIKWVKDNNK